MIVRDLSHDVLTSLKQFPVVALLGPRQCGKTTLAKSLQRAVGKPTVYLDLELPSDAARLSDAELYLRSLKGRLVIIDEIQRQPGLFQVLRALVDEDRKPGRYLLLGSASGELLRQSAESLAGRLEYLELTPFQLDEVLGAEGANSVHATLHRLWLRGGYPPSYLAKSVDASRRWRQSFIATYLERDIPQLGLGLPAVQLRRFWEMLAHLSGQLWNASHVASSLGVSAPTARRYLDVLEGTFIARQLQPYHPRSTKRLVKAPKVYVRDTGILHELLRVADREALLGHPAAGPSWEGFVIEQTLARLPRDWSAHFYRTHAGTEIDLVLARPGCGPIAVEIKLASAPRLTAGTLRGMDELDCEKGYVVVPPAHQRDDRPFPLHDRVVVLPLTCWLEELSNLGRGRR